mmetsp:Transcript_12843/g.29121  ORF Transcript_12843/g.29121 Transcript_12843/m.29121 type:complete len:569 (-) Transcript_12843:65-1771(-)|eukprot:CAMPEP_0197891118 /NCGR_PEP_ID=MMETSP1439-20131203/27380_1 /TAXON_ID=66791 /ORGANISM="Gonyaulax spinifera, Strain CCMP409" /LENGTH=568 /DNA_ID=CAMNT_0043511193 /DNA_START=64 /DNA_END=1773 /DNA_ORIENTATION=+
MGRRIDALYCSKATADKTINGVIKEVKTRAEAARQEVSEAVAKRIEALEARKTELLAQIDKLSREKVKVLEQQLKAIDAGSYPPSTPEDPDEAVDPDKFTLCADNVISFRFGEADFLEKIPEFGVVGEASTYASKSYVKGPAIGILKATNPSYVWVYACDREGKKRKDGADNVVAKFSSPDAFDNLKVEDLKDGRYKITFVPLQAGDFTLDITIGPEGAEEAVQGSPFGLVVRPKTDYPQLGSQPEGEGKAKIGESQGVPLHEFGSVHHPSGIDFDHTGNFYFVADQSNHRIQVFRATDHMPLALYGKKGHAPADFDTPCDIVAEAPWAHGGREVQLVVSDLLNHRLQVLEYNVKTMEFRHVRHVGGRGEGEGQFQFPKGMALTEHGQVMVCDSGNHRVQVFDMLDNFKFVRQFGHHGTGEGQFDFPLDAAINCDNEILVSDSCHRIQVFDIEGNFSRQFGIKGRKEGMFNQPTNMCVDDENALYICDQSNHRVQVLNASTGACMHKWGGKKKAAADGEDGGAPSDEEPEEGEKAPDWTGLRAPGGIAVNTNGLVLVSDYLKNVIYAF